MFLFTCVFNEKDIIAVDSTKYNCFDEEDDVFSSFCLQVAGPEIIFQIKNLGPASLEPNSNFLELILIRNYLYHTVYPDSNSEQGDFTVFTIKYWTALGY